MAVPVADGFDDLGFAVALDGWSRTFRSKAWVTTPAAGATSRHGLTVLPAPGERHYDRTVRPIPGEPEPVVHRVRYVIFTGANERAVIAVCRHFRRSGIACSLIARPGPDPMRKTRFVGWIEAVRRVDRLDVDDMLAALAGYSPLADLRRLAMPVRFVNGRYDPLRLDEWRYRRAAPLARLTVVPHAGHDVNTHRPAAFTGALLDFLAELRLPVVPVA